MSVPEAPTLVTLYALRTEGWVVAARFSWAPGLGVSLEVVDPRWEDVARSLYEGGAPNRLEGRAISPDEGALFMRALLQPMNASYYRFVDESGAGRHGGVRGDGEPLHPYDNGRPCLTS
jgi:hypothetical protein